jgi:hypothetical protein
MITLYLIHGNGGLRMLLTNQKNPIIESPDKS